jgi:trehalose 6-phosphate phosphatase
MAELIVPLAWSANPGADVSGALIPSLDACALLFDIDGTLINLAPTPDSVVVSPSLLDNLYQLHERTSGALALVSGRSLPDIDGLMAPLRLPAVGGHGAEMRLALDGEVRAATIPPIDAGLKRRFARIAEAHGGVLLEDKGYSIALHYRLAPHVEELVYREVAALRADLPEAPIEILPGKFVVEIKHAGFSKATAVRELMTISPFKGRHPVFLGDDVTDESVFAIMPDLRGFAFSVGTQAQGVSGYFDSPDDVRLWLGHLLSDERATA